MLWKLRDLHNFDILFHVILLLGRKEFFRLAVLIALIVSLSREVAAFWAQQQTVLRWWRTNFKIIEIYASTCMISETECAHTIARVGGERSGNGRQGSVTIDRFNRFKSKAVCTYVFSATIWFYVSNGFCFFLLHLFVCSQLLHHTRLPVQ